MTIQTLINVDILLDDNERHWWEGQEVGQHVIIMDRKYNRHLIHAERVFDWLDFEELILKNDAYVV